MTDASLSATTARAIARSDTHRRILGINLALNLLIGLCAVLVPGWLNATLFGAAVPPGPWLPLWGIALIFLAALYFPGWYRPTVVRMPNLIGPVERGVTGIAFLIAGMPLFGAYALAFGLLLAWTYYRLFQAELATRP